MLTARDIEKQVRPKEAGASDGQRDFPATNAAPFASKTETDVLALCEDEAGREQDKLSLAVSDVRNQASAIRKSIPPDIANLGSTIRSKLKGVLFRHADAVGKAAIEVERRAKDYRQFRVLNDRTFEPDYNDSIWDVLGTAFFLIAVESAANAFFFGQASEAGLAGGFITAGMISAANVIVGFATGAGVLRQFNHVKKWRLLLAIPALLVLLPAAVVFNLIVGHYREALIVDPDAIIVDIIPAAMGNLFDIRSLESVILVMLGLCIFAFSVYKGFKVWDTYPGYMSKHRKMRQAEEDLVDVRTAANKQVERELGGEISRFESVGPLLRAKRAETEALSQKLDGALAVFNTAVDQIEQAGDMAIKIYRDANQQVRSPRKKAPAYFETDFKLDRAYSTHDLDAARGEISALTQKIGEAETAFQSAERELTEERIAILTQLEEALSHAETEAKSRAKAEFEEERTAREQFGEAKA